MNQALLVQKVKDYLRDYFGYRGFEYVAVVSAMTEIARMGGYDLDGRFALAGLGAGPAARGASLLMLYALMGISPNKEIKDAVAHWQRLCRNERYSESYQCLFY